MTSKHKSKVAGRDDHYNCQHARLRAESRGDRSLLYRWLCEGRGRDGTGSCSWKVSRPYRQCCASQARSNPRPIQLSLRAVSPSRWVCPGNSSRIRRRQADITGDPLLIRLRAADDDKSHTAVPGFGDWGRPQSATCKPGMRGPRRLKASSKLAVHTGVL
ncbi:uncharacterized protein K452DRAFT_8477 [Aplosporella prunicola CBS 121167]|uniref:Uncharacterized protein n=1 Tax=Aplosporella prunicola CBS 121167 TaxID=1176127 RepID=A0A6A6BU37_9PEZI|nr:uncharacterized protein K452DRAFT_8477 [Aplosporella prunicola CBS 121167]KAF2147520.1 hypothetical protein K452DRAFT_8477 [Aplosporella prunicola CBS 121167]